VLARGMLGCDVRRLVHCADLDEPCGIRAIEPPLIPAAVLELMREVLPALLLAAAQRADALQFAEQQRVIPFKVAAIDFKQIHAAE